MSERSRERGLPCGCVMVLAVPAILVGGWLALGAPLPDAASRARAWAWVEGLWARTGGAPTPPGTTRTTTPDGYVETGEGGTVRVTRLPDGTIDISGEGTPDPTEVATVWPTTEPVFPATPEPTGPPPTRPPPVAPPTFEPNPYTGKYGRMTPLGEREPTSFHLPPGDVTDRNMQDLSKRHLVTHVTARGGEALTDRGAAALAWLPRLQQLDLSGCSGIGDGGVQPLSGLRKLQVLRLGGGRERTPIGDRGAAALGDLEELGILQIVKAEVGDVGVAGIAAAKRLTDLDLQDNPNVTDRGAGALRDHRNLRRLDLSGTGITDRGVAELAWIKPLSSLRILDTEVTGSGFAAFRGHGNLENVDLSGSKVDDRGLAYLAEVGSLRRLAVRTTGVTARGVRALESARGLQELDLTGCRGITPHDVDGLARLVQLRVLRVSSALGEATLAKLRAALPRCEVR